jgi:NADPH2:quinone reductase
MNCCARVLPWLFPSAALLDYLKEGALAPTIARAFPTSGAAQAVRYLIDDRPFGRVIMHAQD